jgi:hypothetical protein
MMLDVMKTLSRWLAAYWRLIRESNTEDNRNETRIW